MDERLGKRAMLRRRERQNSKEGESRVGEMRRGAEDYSSVGSDNFAANEKPAAFKQHPLPPQPCGKMFGQAISQQAAEACRDFPDFQLQAQFLNHIQTFQTFWKGQRGEQG